MSQDIGTEKFSPAGFSNRPWRKLIFYFAARTNILSPLVADVAKLADALDSEFHFYRFQRASSRFNIIS